MTGIKPTVSLFRVWQRELDGVLTYFSTTYTFYYCGYVLTLPWSSCYSSHVTHCDCDVTIVTLWQSHVILSHTPSCSCKSNKKRKERNINNDLAVLLSHNRRECGKVSHHRCHTLVTVTWQEVTTSHHMMSHDRYGKIVHRPCSSCISSIENLTGTLSSSLC